MFILLILFILFCQVVIKLIKVDYTPPQFDKVHNVSVYEDVAVGQPIMQFKATGERGGKLTFSIVSGNEEKNFIINKTTG